MPALTLIFQEMKIDGWQVVKTGPDSLDVRICCSGEILPEDKAHILRVLRNHAGDTVRIAVIRVDHLCLSSAGKLKPVWSEVDGDKASLGAVAG